MPPGKNQRSLDWEAVWKSLNWDDDARQDAAEHERLQQRARQYAAPVREKEAPPDDSKTVLVFELGLERYGVEVAHVRGIRAITKIARVPGVPEFYRGVMNMRGQIISILDLRYFFGVSINDVLMPEEIVLAYANKLEIGLLAHQVEGVVTLPPSAIKSVEHTPYTHGVTTDRVVLLNLAQLFADERLIVGGREP